MKTLTTRPLSYEYITVQEIAADLRVNRATAASWIRNGSIPAITFPTPPGGREATVRVRRDVYETWKKNRGFCRVMSPNVILSVGCCRVSSPAPYEVLSVEGVFDAAIAISCRYPSVIIISSNTEADQVIEIVSGCARLEDYRPAMVVALVPPSGKRDGKMPAVFSKMGFPYSVHADDLTGEAIGLLLRREGVKNRA